MTIVASDLDQFAAEVMRRLGLVIDVAQNASGMQAMLRARLRETGASDMKAYLGRITRGELGALAEQLTVGETYFFRFREQFDALTAALPALLGARADKSLRFLSAACSSGEEAATMAMIVRSSLPDEQARACRVVGVDVNPAAIRRAKRGRYGAWSLRETSDVARARWFEAKGNAFQLDVALRAVLSFSEANLGDADDALWRGEAFDAVFCRNALMYFSSEQAAAVVERLVAVLRPGGLIFFGPTETHLGRTNGLELRHSHGAFYYQRQGYREPLAVSTAPLQAPRPRAVAPVRSSVPAAAPARSEGWADAVSGASLRIAQLRVATPDAAAAAPSPPPSAIRPLPSSDAFGSTQRARVIELLESDRSAEALPLLPPCGDDSEVELLRAISLANSGDHVAAERICRRLLDLDSLQAGAHYLLALCCEQSGQERTALEHYRAAIYLEPRFAMPHVHLGLLARRRGDMGEATRELRVAVALLAEDDAERVTVFGGGLGRDALSQLCRAELRACAGVKS